MMKPFANLHAAMISENEAAGEIPKAANAP